MCAKRTALVIAVVSGFSILLACSSGPRPPEKGTPAFYWQSAREVYAAGDYMKTIQHLDSLLATDSEFTARALPWELVLKSGVAEGYMHAADNYEVGARNNHAEPGTFRRHASDYRNAANQLALQFADDFGKLQALKGDTVTLEFSYPKGTAAPVAQFTKVATGMILSAPETESAQQRSLERGVLLATCRAAGSANDTAKTEQLLRAGVVTVPRAVFMTAMVETLFHFSQLYNNDKLDQPLKRDTLMQRAQEALATLPETPDTKDLKARMQAAAKRAKK